MSRYKLKPGKIGKAAIGACQKVEEKFVDTFLEEDGSLKTGGMAEKVTGACQKVEDAVVGGCKKVEDAFVNAFLEKEDDGDDTEGRHGEK